MSDHSISAVIAGAFTQEAGGAVPSSALERSTSKAAAAKKATHGDARPDGSKAEIVLKKLRLARGVTVAQIMELTGWQSHSVRGFLSAVVRKKLKLSLVSDVGRDGLRRYRIEDNTAKAAD